MRMHAIAAFGLLFLTTGLLGAEDANASPAERPVIFQKEVAPTIGEALGSYPEARKRYLAGLPQKTIFYVSVRLTDGYGYFALAQVRVSRIAVKKAEISGRITNALTKIDGYHKGDDIDFPEAKIVDWKIVHPDGTEEGNLLGKFLAARGPDTDVPALLQDERDAAAEAFAKSPALTGALDKLFLEFFATPTLKIERITRSSAVEEWPALAAKYHGMSADAVLADLNEKITAVKETRKILVEDMELDDKPVLVLTVYLALKKGERIFETRQFLHFHFKNKTTIEDVSWGMRSTRLVNVKARQN